MARKGLILGRLLGYRGAPPVAEDLVPPSLRKVTLAKFVEALPDARRRVARDGWSEARAAGQVLRYVVRATPTSVRRRPAVGTRGQPRRHPARHAAT